MRERACVRVQHRGGGGGGGSTLHREPRYAHAHRSEPRHMDRRRWNIATLS